MAPFIAGLGYEWAFKKTAKCIEELVDLAQPDSRAGPLLSSHVSTGSVAVTCKSGDQLDHLIDGSVDLAVVDPPYYDNVMYAELSDFFYVWLKRTAGLVVPELFRAV